MPNMIKIWPWKQSPRKYRLCNAGRWIAYVPAEYHEFFKTNVAKDIPLQVRQLENFDYVYNF